MRKRFKSKKINNINRLLIFIVIFLISFNIGYKYLKNKIIKYFSEDNYLNNLINTSFNNQIKYEDLFIPNILEPIFKEEDESKEPIIYIYNTHDEEEYEHNYINSYNISPNVKLASYYLQEQLNNMGIISIVEERSVADLVRKNDWVYKRKKSDIRYKRIQSCAPFGKAGIKSALDGRRTKRVYGSNSRSVLPWNAEKI